ncbi:hypothetical protein BD324DRAFT_637552 [Kockovaella imperatae]|uniref:Uncharacterized protein n=1 Tax=Kockovaella imperatae TaxID=4999 RepID=A0A1Y1U8I0_9TREE|nr:hypothetical protein BD324DRAFT_637552 [Kockovaella imperatae]ORX34322.1 hypothetical protein BD324DRAFT_637552 [Kockovaella imperatae]
MTVYSDQATEDETMTEKPPSMEDDSPVQTRQFLRSICVSRIALAICLPICLAVQVLHLKKNLIGGVMLVADAVGLACVVCAMIAHILSMKPRIERLQRHRIYCYLVFIAILVALILQPIIIAIRVLTTHKALPVERIDIARYAVLSITLIIGGSLRRGPKMCHEAEDRANVFDWSGSSILSFIGLFYVWPLVTRSWRADQLRPTDLPHLEQTMRQSGLREMLEDTVTGTWTERTLLYAAWKGKISIIISCELVRLAELTLALLLDALRTVASFVQIYSMHEIIDSFQNSAEHDRKYKQLMCVGLFLGSTAEVLLASYLSYVSAM